jgi:hypothetical protein
MSLIWLGLFLSIEQTAHWQTPLAQPGLSSSVAAVVSIGKANVRAVYLQPLQSGGYGPAVQVGVSWRLF